MRVLIISAAILACAYGRPSGIIAPLAPIAHIAPVAYSVNAGDIAAAATDAHVNAEDHVRASIDAQREFTETVVDAHNDKARELVDQAKEINEERFWNVEDQKWQSFDAIKTAESKLDGASAELSPALAKSFVGPAVVAPVAVAQPVAYAQPLAVAKPVAYAQNLAVAQPIAYAQPLAHAQPLAVAQPVAYSAVVKPETKTIVTQSLSQTHPAPATYIAQPIVKAAPFIEAAPIVETVVPAHKTIIEAQIVPKAELIPAQQTVVTQSLSQTHPAPPPVIKYAAPLVEIAQPAAFSAYIQPETKSVVTSSLSQTHGAPYVSAGYVSAPYAYSAPIYNQLASAW